jgi:hypothetical protein
VSAGAAALMVLVGGALDVPTGEGNAPLPRGSLVQVQAAPCGLKVTDVLAVPERRTLPGDDLGRAALERVGGPGGCVSADAVQPLGGGWLVGTAPLPGAARSTRVPAGTVLEGPITCEGGGGYRACSDARGLLPWATLQGTVPVFEADLPGLFWVQAAVSTHAGPTGIEHIELNPQGRVRLPLVVRHDAERLAEEHIREGLDTPERREKAEVGVGPGGAWRHFLGADGPLTDCWADPWALARMVRVFTAWNAHCQETLGHDLERCAPMVGDLSYLDDRRPDPLGHRDHFRGDCVDLRLWRTDGSRYEAYWDRPDDRPGRGGGYDAETTRAFIAFVSSREETSTLLFNDPKAEGARAARGHDDHIHVCVDRSR